MSEMPAPRTDMKQLRKADWDGVEKNVVSRIRALRAVCKQSDVNPLSDKIANDIILPAMELLGRFCLTVEIEEEEEVTEE